MKTLIFTGGHHSSALEVALRLKKLGWEVVWFGHRHTSLANRADSAEYTEVMSHGIKFYELQAGKFYKTFHPVHLLRLPLGFVHAFILLFWLKFTTQTKGIVSFGGYLAVPTVISGWLLGIPAITHEQTIIAGWANRFLAKFCRKIAISWPDSRRYYPATKVVTTGLPIRQEILSLKRHPQNTIFFFGGKQGSHTLNQIVFQALPKLLPRFLVIHQVGLSSQFNDFATASAINNPKYKPFDYMSASAVAASYSASQVVVSRAGAHTIYELAFLKIPCVLIPLPNSSHAEQYKNAQALESVHQAVLLPQSRLSVDSLLSSIDQALRLVPGSLEIVANGTQNLVDLITATFT